jgi:hypothetical protein
MKDVRSDKIILKAKSQTQSEEVGFLIWWGNYWCRASYYSWESDIEKMSFRTQERCISSL